MSETTEINYLPEHVEQASTLGLSLPYIQVESSLESRLARRFLALDVDSLSILPGITEANIEQRMRIRIRSIPWLSKQDKPHLGFANTPEQGTSQLVRLDIPANPNLGDKMTGIRLNNSFWLGILIGDELLSTGLQPERYRKEKISRFQTAVSFTLGSVAGAYGAEDLAIHLLDIHRSSLPAIAMGVVGAFSTRHAMEGHYSVDLLYKDLGKKHRQQASELAAELPVLEYVASK
jgi:hypothetical protein